MAAYVPNIDTGRIHALDMHVHVERDSHGHLSLDDELMDASAAYFKASDNRTPTVSFLAEIPRSQHGGGRVHHRRRNSPGPRCLVE